MEKLGLTPEISKETLQRDIASNSGLLEEVIFARRAPVADCFKSALKCWRIYEPNVINLENSDITDDHVKQLCDFLRGRNMVRRLNLRRNQIGNPGAARLGELI